jgi:hypothetical protein
MNLANKLLEIINNADLGLKEIPENSTSEKYSADKWSRKEILGHLIDSATINYYRFLTAQFKDSLIFDTYPQDDCVKIQNYNEREWYELIELWKMINLHILELIKNIPDDKLNRSTVNHNFYRICWNIIDKGEVSSLRYLILDYFGHLEHHITQILNYKKG